MTTEELGAVVAILLGFLAAVVFLLTFSWLFNQPILPYHWALCLLSTVIGVAFTEPRFWRRG